MACPKTKAVEKSSKYVMEEEKSEGKMLEGHPLLATTSPSIPPSGVVISAKKDLKGNVVLEEQKFRTKMSDLNENCCLEVLEQLNLLDLATMADVNRMFKKCAEKSFKTFHSATLDFDNCGFDISSKNNFERVLNKFGASTECLRISMNSFKGTRNGKNVLNSIASSCGTNMRKLTLGKFYSSIDLRNFDTDEIKANCRLVSQLKELIFSHTNLRHFSVIFDCCESTIETFDLCLFSMDDSSRLGVQRNYPNLKTLIVDIFKDHTFTLISLNPTIRKLWLKDPPSQQLLDAIVSLPDLSDLEMEVPESLNIDGIAHINKLGRLKLNVPTSMYQSDSLRNSLVGHKTLTHLDISSQRLNNNLMMRLSKIPSLQVLKLHTILNTGKTLIHEPFYNLIEFYVSYYFAVEDKVWLPQVITMMPNLRELYVGGTYCGDRIRGNTNTFSLNLEVVQEISNLRSAESKLILFWYIDHNKAVKVNAIQSIIAVQRVPDDLTIQNSSRFDYNTSETQKAFSNNYERLLDIANREQFVMLDRVFGHIRV